MTTQLLLAQGVSMQHYISKANSVFISNLTPYATYNKLDTATTNKLNLSKRIAPMLMGMTGADMSSANIAAVEDKLAAGKETGLEMLQEVYMWVQKPSQPEHEIYENASNPFTINVVLPVLDINKLKSFLTELFGAAKINAATTNNGTSSFIHNQTLVNWSKDRLIIARSTITKSFFDDDNAFNNRINTVLGMHASDLTALKASASIHSDANYQQHLHKDSDMDFWVNYRDIVFAQQEVPAQFSALYESIMEFAADLKIGANGFLKNGEAQLLIESYTGEAMTRIMAASYNVKVNKDFFKYLNKKDLIGMYMVAMNLEGMVSSYGTELYKVLEKTKEGLMITNVMDIVDIFVDEQEIYSLLKGDLLFAVTGVQSFDRTSTDYEYSEESDTWEEVKKTKKEVIPTMAMMLSYGNEENIMKFVDLASNAGLITKNQAGVWTIGGIKEEMGFDVYVVVKEGVFMLTNDAQIIKNIQTGFPKSYQMDAKDLKDVLEYVQYGFLDFDQMMAAVKLGSTEMNIELPAQMKQLEATFDRIEMISRAPKGNETTSELRLMMKDKNTNVLQSMFGIGADLAKLMLSGASKNTEEEKGIKKL
jgi:hypothetical protein